MLVRIEYRISRKAVARILEADIHCDVDLRANGECNINVDEKDLEQVEAIIDGVRVEYYGPDSIFGGQYEAYKMNKLKKQLEERLQNIHCDILAIYEPDGSDTIWGEWYCAAVNLFSDEFTFRVYFSLQEDGSLKIENIERWHFG